MHVKLEINFTANRHLGIGIANRFWNIKNTGVHTKYEHESSGIQVSHVRITICFMLTEEFQHSQKRSFLAKKKKKKQSRGSLTEICPRTTQEFVEITDS